MKLYNSLTREKDEFTVKDNTVRMYTCGPTVYHFAHIGNLRSYIMEDILEKYLRYLGYDVKRVMNITDVGHLTGDSDDGEDKMLNGAKREHKTVHEIAKFYTDAFFDDCVKLNIRKPDTVVPATSCIPDFIQYRSIAPCHLGGKVFVVILYIHMVNPVIRNEQFRICLFCNTGKIRA